MLRVSLLLFVPIFVMGTTIYESAVLALKTTYKLKVQDIEYQIRQKHEDKAKTNNYPKVDLNLYKKREKTEFAAGNSNIQESTNYSVTISQNIYNGGYDSSAIKMAQQDSAIAKSEYQNIKQQVIYEAINTHIGVLLAKERMQIKRRLIAQYQSLLSIVNKKAQYGDANEKVELQSKLYNAKVEYQQIKEDYELKKLQYYEMTGRDATKLNYRIHYKRKFIKDPLKVKLTNNQELVKNLLEIEKAQYKIAQERSKFLPKVDLELKAYKAEPLAQVDYVTENQYSVKINVSYNLYNGGADAIDNEISRLERLKLMAKRDDLHRDTRLKYYDYYTKYQYSQKNIKNLNRFIANERNKYYRYKKIFKLSSQKGLLDILGALEGLYGAQELKSHTQSIKILNYANMLLVQSKLSLKNLR